MAETAHGELYLGGLVDPESGERSGDPLTYGARRFTTHGVIVGMTGSGKTGLGVVLLEEALLSGVPALILDPKGDMGNLLLTFPELRGSDFRPWIDEAEATRKGMSTDDFADATASTWREGLAGWGIDGERLRRLRDAAEFTIYTPGSTAGIPLNVVGSLQAPPPAIVADAEAMRDEIESFTSSLLSLAGMKADPITSPEHVLIATIIEHAWSRGHDMDLASLISQIQKPPIRKLGVFDLDAFVPPQSRLQLAMRLNGLVASPSFASWLEGLPLGAEELLYTADGRPRASVIYMAHLSDEERQFVVTLLLSRMITWMRGKPGTSDLRALIYMDEVFGFVPPTAAPPSKKPILTILKQARAHGLGMILSTQNPVDLDYKAMSNAGTWMVGRLQTERDKARILEALESATGTVDVDRYDELIGGLGKRQFLFQTTRTPEPRLFTTRWAMSYLRGAITRDEVKRLMADAPRPVESGPASPAAPVPSPTSSTAPLPDDETRVPPAVADGVPSRYLEADAPWAADLGVRAGSTRLRAGIAARVALVFDERAAGVDHREEWEAVWFPIDGPPDPESLLPVDYDDRDWSEEAPQGARYVLPEADLSTSTFFRKFQTQLKEYLYRTRSVSVFRNRELKLYSRIGETRPAFLERCDAAAEDRADAEVAKLRDKYEAKIARVESQLSGAERRVRELESDVSGRKQQELMSAAGDLLSVFVGGRRRSRTLSGYASRRSQTRRAQERLTTAQEKVDDKVRELEELEDALGEDIQEISSRWDERGRQVESVEIGLEKSDVFVEELVLFWAPVE